MEAWENVSSPGRLRAVPLFELEFTSKATLDDQLLAFAKSVFGKPQHGEVIAVDSQALGFTAAHSITGCSPVMFLAQLAAPNGVGVRPVVRVTDPATFVQDATLAARRTGEGITVRVDRGLGQMLATGAADLKSFCNSYGLAVSDVHVLIDFGSIHGANLVSLATEANGVLSATIADGPWASVTLASGAFPPNITAFAKGARTTVPRLDAELWNTVSSTLGASKVFFGDYGIRYPEVGGSTPAPRGPLPNLKYCTSQEWIVWREQTLKKFPNSSFYAVCAGIVAQPEYSGPGFSWGDGIIHSKSMSLPGPKGAGTGTHWIKYALNHHLEFAIDRLSRLGVA